MTVTLAELAQFCTSNGIPCEVDGNPNVCVSSVATLEEATEGQISFLSNPRYESKLAATRASAVMVKPEVAPPRSMDLIRSQDPYAAVTAAMVRLHGYRRHPQWGISPKAFVADSARVGPDANIAPNAYIEDNVIIGRNATIYPGVYIARGCQLGDDVTLFPNVVIYDSCVLGHRVTIHAGSIIGEDGLGYAPVKDRWVKIPQIGNVIIADDVEIGAACTIDRATLGSTTIGRGTKFSNLIAIGHGTKIGEDCMFVAQVGIAGSVSVGRHVTMAGQAGVVGHIAIGDDVTVGAKAGVTNSIKPGVTVLGQPAVPINDCKRQLAVAQRLPELRNEVRQLRRELDLLRDRLAPEPGEQEPSAPSAESQP